MTIAYDAQRLIDDQKTGIGFYADGVVSTLMTSKPELSFILQIHRTRGNERERQLQRYKRLGGTVSETRLMSYGIYRALWSFIPIPYSLLFRRHADITHFFNFLIPPGVKGKRVVTIHDMGYKAFPETARLKTKLALKLNLKKSCERADAIVTISEFSKQEIIRHLCVPPEKITVIPCGVNLERYTPVPDFRLIEQAKTRFGISRDYFLYIGTLEPRKNIERLIDAYSMLTHDVSNAPLLVLAGGKGWLYDSVFEKIKSLGLEKQVIFTGYVDDADVPPLLCGAVAFVFPSLYEGFGMPPLEAMACGVPVLTSNCSSLPEVVGDCAVLVDPRSVEDIASGMKRLMSDGALRSELSRKGLERAKLFTWERAAELTMRVYESLTAKI